VLVDETWHSTASHVSGLERDMSTLSVDKSSASSSSKPSHSRSHSGGYVNLALSNSIDDEEPPLDELNMSTALATIKVLAKKAKQSKADESCNLSVVSAKTTTSRAISIANGMKLFIDIICFLFVSLKNIVYKNNENWANEIF